MGGRIFVVDDDADMRRLMSSSLHKAGYDVVEAASGEEAVLRIPEIAPDLILLDIVMPGMDGFAVCERLKGDPRTSDIAVIFLSARGEAADKIRGLEIGAADYVTKPFDRGELLARVGNQLKIHRLTREVMEANRDLREKQRRLDEDLRAAAEIQSDLLPQKLPVSGGVGFAWRFEPSQVIGGDVFNAFQLDNRTLGLYMADVSGHGAAAALLTASISQVLQPHGDVVLGKGREGKRKPRSPGEVLERLDREYPLERFDRYFTIFYALLNTESAAMVYSSAGHPPPLLVCTDGTIRRLDRGGTIIGLGKDVPFEEGREELNAGDRVFFYTDGLIEHQGTGEPYGMDRLAAFLAAGSAFPLPVLLDRLLSDLRGFGEDRAFQDDVSVMALEFSGKNRSDREVGHAI